MTTSTNSISLSQLDAMRAALGTLTEKPKTQFSSREAIAAMADDIRRARTELGYSLEDIVQLLQPHGLAICPNTLRGYLRGLEKDAEAARNAAATARAARPSRAKPATPKAPPVPAKPSRIVFEDLPPLEEENEEGPADLITRLPHG